MKLKKLLMRTYICYLAVLIGLLFLGCQKKTIFIHDFKDNKWDFHDSIIFTKEITKIVGENWKGLGFR